MNKEKEKERKMRRRKGVYLDCDKTVKLVACDEIHLGDQRWIHRQHGVYQEAVDEAPMVCPYSNSKRSRTLTPISAAPQLHPRTVSYNGVFGQDSLLGA